jgi:hypothetical protein
LNNGSFGQNFGFTRVRAVFPPQKLFKTLTCGNMFEAIGEDGRVNLPVHLSSVEMTASQADNTSSLYILLLEKINSTHRQQLFASQHKP